MNQPCSISVVVPVYNVAGYLRAALDSLLAQDVRDWTAVCVDDGSTDGSGAILDEYAARDARIQVVHQPNGGVSAARNAALDRATGEIVAFLDPDDLVARDWLAKLQEGIRGVDLAWGGMTMDASGALSQDIPGDVGCVYEGDAVRRRVWRAVFGYRLRDLLGVALPGGMWRRCRREFGIVMCRAIRRSVLGNLRFDCRVRLCEDALFLAAFAQRAKSMRVIGETGYRYFVRPGGAMTCERRLRMTPYKFAARDIRREIDPRMTHWRGSFLLSAADILLRTGLGAAWRYLTFRPERKTAAD